MTLFSARAHQNPEKRLVFERGRWLPSTLHYTTVQRRLRHNRTRPCTRCLGSGLYFDDVCELCSGWGELMVIKDNHDVRKSS